MSYRVKPEDVPEAFAIELQDNVSGVTVESFRRNISDIINALIEAGLVSPPCYVTRYLGELVCQGGTLNPEIYPGKPKEKGDEHYKGQTS